MYSDLNLKWECIIIILTISHTVALERVEKEKRTNSLHNKRSPWLKHFLSVIYMAQVSD